MDFYNTHKTDRISKDGFRFGFKRIEWESVKHELPLSLAGPVRFNAVQCGLVRCGAICSGEVCCVTVRFDAVRYGGVWCGVGSVLCCAARCKLKQRHSAPPSLSRPKARGPNDEAKN